MRTSLNGSLTATPVLASAGLEMSARARRWSSSGEERPQRPQRLEARPRPRSGTACGRGTDARGRGPLTSLRQLVLAGFDRRCWFAGARELPQQEFIGVSTIHPSHLSDAVDIAVPRVTEAVLPAHESAVDEGADSRRRRPPVRGGIVKPAAVREDFLYDFKPAAVREDFLYDFKPAAVREDFLYDFKGGSRRSPPAPAAGGRKRPSSPRLQASAKPGTSGSLAAPAP
jgi:hypothetical protein